VYFSFRYQDAEAEYALVHGAGEIQAHYGTDVI
jgi:hypothetical protein